MWYWNVSTSDLSIREMSNVVKATSDFMFISITFHSFYFSFVVFLVYFMSWSCVHLLLSKIDLEMFIDYGLILVFRVFFFKNMMMKIENGW